MSANGENYRGHTYNPDQIAQIVWTAIGGEGEKGTFYLFPYKKVLRDTKLNQYTLYTETVQDPFADFAVITLGLYRVDDDTETGPTFSRNIATLVAGSTVTSSLIMPGAPVIQSQWALDNPIVIEGGTYWLGIHFYALVGRADTTITTYGVVDTDSSMLYPKYYMEHLDFANLPNPIDISLLTRNTTDWFYFSFEWQ